MSDTGALDMRWLRSFYEQGNWTPTFGATTTDGSYTYTVQVGRYRRIGDTVFIRARIAISAILVAPTGTMRIAGLPFAVGNTANVFGGISFSSISHFNYSATAKELCGYMAPGGTSIDLEESFDAAASISVPAANFTDGACSLIFIGDYLAA